MEAGPRSGVGDRERKRRATLESIREAALELFTTHDFDNVTMKDVAVRAGVGEATLFRYVDQKLELLTLVYGDKLDTVLDGIELDDVRGELEHPSSTGQDYCRRIRAIYTARCRFHLQHPKNGAIFLAQGFNERNPSSGRNIAQGDRTIRLVASIIDQGQRKGVLMAGIDPIAVAQNCHGIHIHEIQRTAIRKFSHESLWDRVDRRLTVQLLPLVTDSGSDHTDRG